jgi:hypothetical protein
MCQHRIEYVMSQKGDLEAYEADLRQRARAVRAAEDLRIRQYRGTKLQYAAWTTALSQHFSEISEGALKIKSQEQAETYWCMIGELYALRNPVPKADFITYWDGHGGSCKNPAGRPIYQANTVRVLIANLIRTDLVKEFSDRGTRKIQLSEKAKGMFEQTSDVLILSSQEMLHDFPNGLDLIRKTAKDRDQKLSDQKQTRNDVGRSGTGTR